MNTFNFVIDHPFYEFAIILFLAALLGSVGQLLKQPLIVVFIALGIIVGPSVLNIAQSKDQIELLAQIGIAILLFIVGLKLDVRIIKSVGRIALLTGMGQVIFTSLVGYFIGVGLGFTPLHSFYIAVALTFSSTIVIVKLLSDKKEIDSLHGQIAVGFLIIQDIVVIIVMIILSAMQQQRDTSLTIDILMTISSGIVLILLTWIMMKWILPGLSQFLAKSQELLTLFAVAWAISLASLGEWMDFSGEVGAFLAGVSLASSQFKDVISSRLVSLRDFLLLFFFVNLGANLNLSVIGNQVPAAFIFSFFVLIGNPIIVLIIMGLMGYRKRTSFLAGLTVAQISEFSLIFAGLGLAVGHITEDIVGLITLVGLITIGLSTYLILYSHPIYDFISPALKIFEKKNPYREEYISVENHQHYDVIIFGLGRFGNKITEKMDSYPDIHYLGIDFDPQIIRAYKERGKSVVYGDAEDSELLEYIPFLQTKCIIINIPDINVSVNLVKVIKRQEYSGKLYVAIRNDNEYDLVKDCGADEILFPFEMAANNFYNEFLQSQLKN